MTPNKPEHISRLSADGAQINLDALYRIAPSAFTEAPDPQTGRPRRAVDFDALRQLLGDCAVQAGDGEMYRFTWVGKRAARAEAARPTDKTLRPVPQDSLDWDTTKNLYIEGDNLEVLKLLQRSYMGRVKMIYIDPPYNTGNDFVYRDDFRRTAQEEDRQAGNVDELGNRFRRNTDSNGRFHSDWCSMIYSRLLVARSLLTEDGVIFISIDDNEVENLRKICDEVFGEGNFVATLVWEKKYTISNDAKYFSDNHDYILCISKSIDSFVIGKLPRTEEMNAAYKNPDNHPKGPWKSTPLHARSGSANTAGFSYTFKNGMTFTPPTGTYPRYSPEALKRMDDNDEIWFGKDGKSIPSRKTFLCDLKNEGVVPRTIIPYTEGGHNHEADEEVKELLTKKVFTSPKPVSLLKHLITVGNIRNDSLILDFFSGSATTAHAVMQLNAEHGGNRKFIMVQLPEETAEDSEARKAGYKNICEIGKERIRRAGAKIKADSPLTTAGLDTGFRVFRLDESNYEQVSLAPGDYKQEQLDLFADNIKAGRTDLDLLFGAMLSWGVTLDLPMTAREVDGCRIYTVNGGDLVACLSEGVTDGAVRAMAAEKPRRVLFRDACFDTDDKKINVYEQFKQAMDWTDAEAFSNIKVI